MVVNFYAFTCDQLLKAFCFWDASICPGSYSKSCDCDFLQTAWGNLTKFTT